MSNEVGVVRVQFGGQERSFKFGMLTQLRFIEELRKRGQQQDYTSGAMSKMEADALMLYVAFLLRAPSNDLPQGFGFDEFCEWYDEMGEADANDLVEAMEHWMGTAQKKMMSKTTVRQFEEMIKTQSA